MLRRAIGQGSGETSGGQMHWELPCGSTEVALSGVTLEKVSANHDS